MKTAIQIELTKKLNLQGQRMPQPALAASRSTGRHRLGICLQKGEPAESEFRQASVAA